MTRAASRIGNVVVAVAALVALAVSGPLAETHAAATLLVTADDTVPDPALPGTPGEVQAEPVDQNALRVRWQAAPPGVGDAGAITGYEIEVDQPAGVVRTASVPASAGEVDVTQLTGGAALPVRVYALSAAGRSPVPGTASATPTDVLVPSPVSTVTAVSTYGGGATIRWTGSPSFDVRNYAVRW